MRKIKNLETVFPVWKIEQDNILDKQGNITVAFSVSLPEIFTLSTADYEVMHSSWVKAIKTLPTGTILHKQDWFMETSHKADFEKPGHS